MDLNWLTPKAQVRPAGGKGWGSYVTAPIAAGTTVAGFGGYMVTREVLDTLPLDRATRSIQVDEDLYLLSAEAPEPGDMVNHSCDPTCGLMGGTILVALRDLEPGDELTFDYATCDGSDYDEFTCLCAAADCRGTVTGADWRLPQLHARYAGWFSPYLARRIAALEEAPHDEAAFA